MDARVEDLVERLARGNVTEVKVVVTTVALALAVKVVIIRWWHSAGRFLPVLGISVFLLLAATWAGTAGAFLA